MRIGVLGTGVAGRTPANKLVALGHEVMMGSRQAGNEAAAAWAEMYLPLWLRLYGATGTARLNIEVVI